MLLPSRRDDAIAARRRKLKGRSQGQGRKGLQQRHK
jgi:hypothetical protein